MSADPAKTATVLLVEDDAPTRERLARAIEGHPRLVLLRACGSVEAAQAFLGEAVPGVLLTGPRFPEIARLLGISLHTVTTHVRHIYVKLEVSSRGEAVFEAVQRGLIRLGE